jgi:hypothetical protein
VFDGSRYCCCSQLHRLFLLAIRLLYLLRCSLRQKTYNTIKKFIIPAGALFAK